MIAVGGTTGGGVCGAGQPAGASTSLGSSRNLLFRSDLFGIGTTRCCPSHAGLTPERALAGPTFSLARRGVFVVHSEGREAQIDPSTAVFHNPAETFRASHPASIGDECTWFAPSERAVRDALRVLNLDAADDVRPFRHLTAPVSRDAFTLHVELFKHLTAGSPDPLFVDETACCLLHELMRSAAALYSRGRRPRMRDDTCRAHAGLAEAARAVLATRFDQRITIDDVAAAVHSSPFNLCRIFRAHTGLSIHAYLTDLRVREAVHRLIEGDTDLAELARRVGFASHSHMCDAFRRVLGRSPTAAARGPAVRGSAPLDTP